MPKRPAKMSKRIQKKRKLGFSWRQFARSTRSKKTLKKGLALFVIFLASFVFLSGLWAYKTLTKSFANAESISSYDINNKEVITLVIVSVEDRLAHPIKTKSIHLLIFDKLKGKVLTYEIDPNIKTDAAGKFGEEPYANLLAIGMMNDEMVSSGASLLIETIKKDFAFNIDKYMVINEDIVDPLLDTFVYGKGNDLLNLNVLKEMLSIDTNVMLNEFYDLFSFVRSLRPDRFLVNPAYDVTSNKDLIDDALRDITFDSRISKEKTSVGILNGTDMPGIAGFASRVVRNAGGYVISAENASQQYDKSLIIVTASDFAVVDEIQTFFGIDNVVLKDRAGVNEGISDRVDVTLVIGFDISERL